MIARTASSKISRLSSIVDAERLQFGRGGAFAHAHLDPALRQQVEGRDALGDAGGMVGGELADAVAEADLLGALAGGGEEELRRRRVGVFLEEVMLDLPRVVVAALVGELDLLERVLVERQLVVRTPGPRQLQLVENAEFHRALSFARPNPRAAGRHIMAQAYVAAASFGKSTPWIGIRPRGRSLQPLRDQMLALKVLGSSGSSAISIEGSVELP